VAQKSKLLYCVNSLLFLSHPVYSLRHGIVNDRKLQLVVLANGLAIQRPSCTEHSQVQHVYCDGDKRVEEHWWQAGWYEHDPHHFEHPESVERRRWRWSLDQKTPSCGFNNSGYVHQLSPLVTKQN